MIPKLCDFFGYDDSVAIIEVSSPSRWNGSSALSLLISFFLLEVSSSLSYNFFNNVIYLFFRSIF